MRERVDLEANIWRGSVSATGFPCVRFFFSRQRNERASRSLGQVDTNNEEPEGGGSAYYEAMLSVANAECEDVRETRGILLERGFHVKSRTVDRRSNEILGRK